MKQKEQLEKMQEMFATTAMDGEFQDLQPNHTERFSHIPELGDIMGHDCDNSYGNGCCRELTCPECKETYMHQADVRVINRKEDCDGVVTHINHDNHIMQADVPAEEIVGRRDTIEIDYDCEYCGRHTLQLHQHKGSSLIKWIR